MRRILLLASITFAAVESARSPLSISGTTISHQSGDGQIHVPRSFGATAGYQLTTNGGSGDAYWAPAGGAASDSARVAGLSDSAKALVRYARTTALHDTADALRKYTRDRIHDTSLVLRQRITDSAAAVRAAIPTGGPWLPLAAGAGSPLTGDLYGTRAILTTTADAPISISHNLAGGFTHPLQAFNSGMVAGNQYNFDFGQSASTNNAANFGFKYVGAGSLSNYVTLGMYGANDLLTITAAGVPKFSGLTASKFVKTDASKNLISTDVAYSDLTGTVPTWNQNTTGNAATATKWAAARNLTIGSSTQAIDGTGDKTFSLAAIGAVPSGNVSGAFGQVAYFTGAAAVTGSPGMTFNGMDLSLPSGSVKISTAASSILKADAAGLIVQATSPDFPILNQSTTGSAAKWTTPRTLTIGATGKTIDGTGNQSWSLAEIGALGTASVSGTANQVAQFTGTNTVGSDNGFTTVKTSGISRYAKIGNGTQAGGAGFEASAPSNQAKSLGFLSNNLYNWELLSVATSHNLELLAYNLGTLIDKPLVVSNASGGAIELGGSTLRPVAISGGLTLRQHATLSTYGAIYGSGVAPGAANYGILLSKNGDYGNLNGAVNVALTVGNAARVIATATGSTLAGTTTLSGLTGATTRLATINAAGQIGVQEATRIATLHAATQTLSSTMAVLGSVIAGTTTIPANSLAVGDVIVITTIAPSVSAAGEILQRTTLNGASVLDAFAGSGVSKFNLAVEVVITATGSSGTYSITSWYTLLRSGAVESNIAYATGSINTTTTNTFEVRGSNNSSGAPVLTQAHTTITRR